MQANGTYGESRQPILCSYGDISTTTIQGPQVGSDKSRITPGSKGPTERRPRSATKTDRHCHERDGAPQEHEIGSPYAPFFDIGASPHARWTHPWSPRRPALSETSPILELWWVTYGILRTHPPHNSKIGALRIEIAGEDGVRGEPTGGEVRTRTPRRRRTCACPSATHRTARVGDRLATAPRSHR